MTNRVVGMSVETIWWAAKTMFKIIIPNFADARIISCSCVEPFVFFFF